MQDCKKEKTAQKNKTLVQKTIRKKQVYRTARGGPWRCVAIVELELYKLVQEPDACR